MRQYLTLANFNQFLGMDGGGLAGLVLASELARAGIDVLVVEKHEYPFHRVCGEYVSNETLPLLRRLGLDPFSLGAVAIGRLRLTSPAGRALDYPLASGGFGLSRYTLDRALYQLAQAQGAKFSLKTTVASYGPTPNGAATKVRLANGKVLTAPMVVSAHGKRANLDQQRAFFRQRSPYIGVKYHLRTTLHPDDLIALHNFADGYCGVSRVEDGAYCLCYLAKRDLLRRHGTIAKMEAEVLHRNPHLHQLWQNSEFLFDQPKVINEVSFAPKTLFESGSIMCGDSAGMIAPLCGNGMAMAMHAAHLLAGLLVRHLRGPLARAGLEREYAQHWHQLFGTRLLAGRTIQRFFGDPRLTELLLRTAGSVPPVARWLIGLTHGRPF
jgi:flavin-dependent dehydrogenase